MNYKQFHDDEKWQKANFHSHSTQSDGLLTPAQLVAAYKEQGYAILMLSEHERYQDTTEFDTIDFILYPGIERSIQLPYKEEFHIQGIANYLVDVKRYQHQEYIPVPTYECMDDVQTIIDELSAHGNFVMINHPYWSCNTFEHLDKLHGYDLLELYNHNCHVETDLGNSEIYYDHVLQQHFVGALATDDNHNSHRYEAGIHMWDSFGGFTMIQSNDLSRTSISKSLAEGRFYASTGPAIYQFEIQDNLVHVTCSPVSHIVFKAWPKRGYRVSKSTQPLEKATYRLRGNEHWIRVKCIDENGLCAWSNPIYIR